MLLINKYEHDFKVINPITTNGQLKLSREHNSDSDPTIKTPVPPRLNG